MLTQGQFYGLIHWCLSALAFVITAYVLPGFEVGSFFSALIIAFVVSIANVLLHPILSFLTFPLTILTLGFFTFVVDAIVLRLCAAVLPNFKIRGWGTAILAAIILTVVGATLRFLIVPGNTVYF